MSSGCRAMLIDGDGVPERVRGYQRKTNRSPYPHITEEFPGKIDTSTAYVMAKVVSRLEMDSRWALARSVRALVAERDALKENLKAVSRSNRQEVDRLCHRPQCRRRGEIEPNDPIARLVGPQPPVFKRLPVC
jgi:hypothetical protein